MTSLPNTGHMLPSFFIGCIQHDFLPRGLSVYYFTTFSDTVLETIIVMWLFGSLWYRWTLPFEVVTPILHLFSSAVQL